MSFLHRESFLKSQEQQFNSLKNNVHTNELLNSLLTCVPLV